MGQYIGVSGVARKVKNMYIGVSGVARKAKNAYIGVSGVARRFLVSSLTGMEYTAATGTYFSATVSDGQIYMSSGNIYKLDSGSQRVVFENLDFKCTSFSVTHTSCTEGGYGSGVTYVYYYFTSDPSTDLHRSFTVCGGYGDDDGNYYSTTVTETDSYTFDGEITIYRMDFYIQDSSHQHWSQYTVSSVRLDGVEIL